MMSQFPTVTHMTHADYATAIRAGHNARFAALRALFTRLLPGTGPSPVKHPQGAVFG